MARADSLAKLAWAYGVHLARRRLRRPRSQLADLLNTYAPDGIRAIDPAVRERHPRLVNCINCGLCALAAGRIGKSRLPDVAGDDPDFAAASAVCPVGLPLAEVATVVRRMTMR